MQYFSASHFARCWGVCVCLFLFPSDFALQFRVEKEAEAAAAKKNKAGDLTGSVGGGDPNLKERPTPPALSAALPSPVVDDGVEVRGKWPMDQRIRSKQW